MTKSAAAKAASPSVVALTKRHTHIPAISRAAVGTLILEAGTVIAVDDRTFAFEEEAPIDLPEMTVPGADFEVTVDRDGHLAAHAWGVAAGNDLAVIGGFHYAPGRNAGGREGSDQTPAINPFSIWDLAFRPACSDPRGMAFVAGSPGAPGVDPFWIDIYLLAADHLALTSRHGVEIADGYKRRPVTLDSTGKRYGKLDYATAMAVLGHHGKQLPSIFEFFAATYGVTEQAALGELPEKTALDAPRTSRFGLMQATGNLWVWGHDGDPDKPRACLFGGSGWVDGNAGSRRAYVGTWPGRSNEGCGARGRSDHLPPVTRRDSAAG